MMTPIVQTITTQAPGISIECVQMTADYAEMVRSGTIDLACMSFPVDTTDLVVKSLGPSDVVIVSRRDHPGITKPLDAPTLLKLPHITMGRELRGLSGIERNMVAQHMQRRMPYAVAKIWSIPPMVQNTDLICFLPRRFATDMAKAFDLDIHETPVPMPDQHFYMMWHTNNEHDPGHRWLREAMQTAYAAPAAQVQ